MKILRNVLIGCGASYLSIWVRVPLEWLWSLVSEAFSFNGSLQIALLMPVVSALPTAVAAFGAGVATTAAAEARYPSRWALLPAGLFLEQHVLGRREWYAPRTTIDYLGIATEAVIPVITCLVGAAILEGRTRRATKTL